MNGDKLLTYIKKKYGSVYKYSVALKISRATISRYIGGSRTPAMEVAKKIVHESNGEISYEDLYGKDQYLS